MAHMTSALRIAVLSVLILTAARPHPPAPPTSPATARPDRPVTIVAPLPAGAVTGIDSPHCPYRGGGPAMQDLIAGRTDYICTLSPTAKPAMDGKLAKALALLSRERSPMLPDLTTAHEQGLTDFDTDTWFGF